MGSLSGRVVASNRWDCLRPYHIGIHSVGATIVPTWQPELALPSSQYPSLMSAGRFTGRTGRCGGWAGRRRRPPSSTPPPPATDTGLLTSPSPSPAPLPAHVHANAALLQAGGAFASIGYSHQGIVATKAGKGGLVRYRYTLLLPYNLLTRLNASWEGIRRIWSAKRVLIVDFKDGASAKFPLVPIRRFFAPMKGDKEGCVL